jgi:hypothetical protein
MKIGRHYLGKIVEVRWLDPNYGKGDLATLKKGRAALAVWREFGAVHDITDGVVILVHSYGTLNENPDKDDEVCSTALPEELIEAIRVLTPEPEIK